MRELPMPESLLRRAVSLHAPRRPARGARLGAARRASSISARSSSASTRPAAASRSPSPTARRRRADAVIGADGVHSLVRDIIVGPDAPIHKGRIAYRAVFPSALIGGRHRPLAHQVVGHRPPHRHLLHDDSDRSEVYFVTSVPEPAEWLTRESWSAKGDVNELRAAYEGFHPDVRARAGRAAPTATSGRSSSASRCRAGATAASCCSAMPAIR